MLFPCRKWHPDPLNVGIPMIPAATFPPLSRTGSRGEDTLRISVLVACSGARSEHVRCSRCPTEVHGHAPGAWTKIWRME